MMFYADKCVGCGRCKEVCPNNLESCSFCGKCELFCPYDARRICGKEYTASEILNEVLKDKTFYENSGGGVTFSGGECMLQVDFLAEVLKLCRQNEIHTAVDTAGHIPWESFEKILPFTDLFLYDIKIFDCEKHKQYVGVDNRLIFENLKKLLDANANVIIRIPVIAGLNDSEEEMQKIKIMLDSFGKVQAVELLSYHAMGENKYRAIGRESMQFKSPEKEKLKALKKMFE